MGATAKVLGICFIATLCTEAAAQLYKCTGPDGKIVYSDTRCEASASGSALKVVPNATTPDPKAAPIVKDAPAASAGPGPGPEAKSAEGALAAPAAPPARAELSYSERERLRSLEMTTGSLGATPEQKEAANLEIRSIRQGREHRLSREDRERRDSLTVDLTSTDRKKRSESLRELRELYYR
jgi:hypothetical protein